MSFRNAGKTFNDIDHIFITHAHNDHTADLESILSLLHDYNEDIIGHRFSEKENSIYIKMMKKYPKKDESEIKEKVEQAYQYSPRRKRLRIYVSPGAKEKCGFLKLGSKQEYEVITLNTRQVNYKDDLATFLNGGVKIPYDVDKYIDVYPIPAKHDDLMTDVDCFGYVVSFMPEKKLLWYTGDTGFIEEHEQELSHIRDLLVLNFGFQPQNMSQYKGMILLAHIGGFKPDEQYYYRSNSKKAFYKYHLGRLGLCKLLECLTPAVCLISEFGEEFEGCRKDLVDIYNSSYTDSIILPADIGLIVRFNDNNITQADFDVEISKDIYAEIGNVAFVEEPDAETKEMIIKFSPV